LFFIVIMLLLFLFLPLASISNMTWLIYVEIVLCTSCVLYVQIVFKFQPSLLSKFLLQGSSYKLCVAITSTTFDLHKFL
jgi:hypothetical protein